MKMIQAEVQEFQSHILSHFLPHFPVFGLILISFVFYKQGAAVSVRGPFKNVEQLLKTA